jgi:hypothetical protein
MSSLSDAHLIVAGQSNVGFNTDTADLIGYVPTARVQVWTDTNGDGIADAWNYLRPGVNASGLPTQPGASGFVVREAQDWLANHSTGYLWIVQVAHGSTGLAQDPTQLDWSPSSAGEMFDTATATITAAMHNLDGTPYAFSSWDAAQWMQGETDATDPAKAAAYNSNLRQLILDARAAWHVETFDVARITDTAGVYSLAVRQAEWALDNGPDPLADAHTFKTLGFGMQADGVHYDSAGQVALGDAFYATEFQSLFGRAMAPGSLFATWVA